uniref:EfeO-type cupredoxin-like domain-containing protein n=1 Tax=Acyrthosiphon pisum TaxID=7029 RepID=A0A8R2HAA9_ACYPI
MTIRFRRKALLVSMLALSGAASAASIPQVTVTVTDKQCEPMSLNVQAGKTQFIIKNNSQKALEWEILKGVMVVEERENIAPGFSQKLTANLEAGEYDMTCGLLTNPKGKLVVSGESKTAAKGKTDIMQLAGPITDYKTYVMSEVKELVAGTQPSPMRLKRATWKSQSA